MTTFHLVLNDLLNAAVSQVFAFVLRSHIGRLQIPPRAHLSEDCAYFVSGAWRAGESSLERSGTDYKKSFLRTTECRNSL